MDTVNITVVDRDNTTKQLNAPLDLGLNLMEFLKANEYNILATCGGIALCATCHVEVLKNYNLLPIPSEEEWAMLDTLPEVFPTSRLSCQIKLNNQTPDLSVKIRGQLEE